MASVKVRIKPLTEKDFDDMGIFSEFSKKFLNSGEVIGVKEVLENPKGKMFYLWVPPEGTMMLWVWEKFVEVQHGIG